MENKKNKMKVINKIVLLVVVLLLASGQVFGQKKEKIYLDYNSSPISSSKKYKESRSRYILVERESNGQIIGIVNTYFLSGKLNSTVKVIKYNTDFFNKSVFDSTYTSYYENGEKEVEKFYKEGKLQGKYTYYYSNGDIASEYYYNNDILEGQAIDWHANNGQKKREYYYVNGEIEGKLTQWYGSGAIEREENYIGGKLEGTATYYYNSGTKNRVANFTNGIPNGWHITYHPNGIVSSKEYFRNGIKIDNQIIEREEEKAYTGQFSGYLNNFNYNDKLVDGGWYSGYMVNGKPNGKGKWTAYVQNQTKYGRFLYGGGGTPYYHLMYEYDGEWKDGLFDGKGAYGIAGVDKNLVIYQKGEWSNNKYLGDSEKEAKLKQLELIRKKGEEGLKNGAYKSVAYERCYNEYGLTWGNYERCDITFSDGTKSNGVLINVDGYYGFEGGSFGTQKILYDNYDYAIKQVYRLANGLAREDEGRYYPESSSYSSSNVSSSSDYSIISKSTDNYVNVEYIGGSYYDIKINTGFNCISKNLKIVITDKYGNIVKTIDRNESDGFRTDNYGYDHPIRIDISCKIECGLSSDKYINTSVKLNKSGFAITIGSNK